MPRMIEYTGENKEEVLRWLRECGINDWGEPEPLPGQFLLYTEDGLYVVTKKGME